MQMVSKEKGTDFKRRKLVSVGFLILDTFLHKVSRIEILRHLAKQGYSVHLIGVRSGERYRRSSSEVQVISIPLRYVPVISPALFVIVLSVFLPFYVIAARPDFIRTEPGPSIFSLIWMSILPRSIGPRVILDIRSTPVETVGLRGRLRVFFFNVSVLIAKKLFDGITTITILMREEICDKFHVDSESVGVWSSGVSPTLFDPEKFADRGMELRKKFGLTDKFVIFYHGNFGVYRGITETIESIEILKTPNIKNNWQQKRRKMLYSFKSGIRIF